MSASKEAGAWCTEHSLGRERTGSLSSDPRSRSPGRPNLPYVVCRGQLHPFWSPGTGNRRPPPPPSATRAPPGSRRVSILGGLGSLVVRGGAQVPVSPPALALLLLLILEGPLPGQAAGRQGGTISAAQARPLDPWTHRSPVPSQTPAAPGQDRKQPLGLGCVWGCGTLEPAHAVRDTSIPKT